MVYLQKTNLPVPGQPGPNRETLKHKFTEVIKADLLIDKHIVQKNAEVTAHHGLPLRFLGLHLHQTRARTKEQARLFLFLVRDHVCSQKSGPKAATPKLFLQHSPLLSK